MLVLTTLLLIPPSALAQGTDYEFRGIPASIEEFDMGFDINGKWTGQVDLQIVTQGAYLGVNNNPFAYWQRAHIRPWIQYHHSKTTMLAASVSWMKRYSIPPQGKHPWR